MSLLDHELIKKHNFNALLHDPEYVAVTDISMLASKHFQDVSAYSQFYKMQYLETDADIVHHAEKIAERFRKFVHRYPGYEGLTQILCDICYSKYGVIPPLPNPTPENAVTVTVPLLEKFEITRPVIVLDSIFLQEMENPKVAVTVSLTGTIFRLCDEFWWRRALRKYFKRKFESEAIYNGEVHSRKGKYASDNSVERYQQQKRRNRNFLEKTIAVNEVNQEFTLQELSDCSVSNPKNRRAELMTRIAGFEDVAKSLNHQCIFYTITCPSGMHTRLSKTGEVNPKYDGTTPKESQDYLVRIWAQMRAKLSRLGITLYGFRIAEPQHDGTLHWHLMLFMQPCQVKTVGEVIREYSLREAGEELGADKHRYREVPIDPKKGSAAGYIAKYISKNIDGFGLDSDLDGGEPKSASERVGAWAHNWDIRQFQQIGGPPVTIWREFRRHDGNGLTGTVKELWEAANNSEWSKFVRLMGGPMVKRKNLVVQLAKETAERLNQYLEPLGEKIVGIAFGIQTILTRVHEWIIHYQTDTRIPVTRISVCDFSITLGIDRKCAAVLMDL